MRRLLTTGKWIWWMRMLNSTLYKKQMTLWEEEGKKKLLNLPSTAARANKS